MDNNEIMVSVICTVYNHEKYLRKCLDGFVMQKTNFKFEVLINDDASTDGSADIIREYEKKYPDIIKPIYQTENQYSKGVNISSTFLLPRAKGKYLAWCEGDDYWCNEYKLQKQFDILENNPNIYMCVHKVKNINEQGEEIQGCIPCIDLKNVIITSEYIIKNLNNFYFQLSSYFFNLYKYRTLKKDYESLFKLCPVGDKVIIASWALETDFYFIDEVMSKYRCNSVGSWTERISKSKEMRVEKNKKWFAFYQEYKQVANNTFPNNKFKIQKLIDEAEFLIYLELKEYKKAAHLKYLVTAKDRVNIREKIFVVLKAYFPIILKIIKK